MKRLNSAPSLEPIWIDIVYDTKLQRITGKAMERTMCNSGCPFFVILHCVLTEYPDIPRRFPPGVLGFTVNGIAPDIDQPMHDGNVVSFSTDITHPFLTRCTQ